MDELLEPLEAEVPEDISSKNPKNPKKIRLNKSRKARGEPNKRDATEGKWGRRGT